MSTSEKSDDRAGSSAGKPNRGAAQFATTHWTEIFSASENDSAARDALDRLCERYWYPLYAFLRRSGHPPDRAEDYVQDFFEELIRRRSWSSADPSRGRFRTFLLAACQNHVRKLHRSEQALKRGGGKTMLSFSLESGETRFEAEPAIEDDPSKAFDRQWAMHLIETALARLADEMHDSGRGDRFEVFKPFFAPGADPPSYAKVAEKLDISEGNVKVAVHRLRRKFADYLRDEVAATVPNDEIESELSDLIRATASDA
ncbi:MAG: sigma-70 family RNA polymerase sigma factor [Planctomycetota bacterium]